ncbi:hypothetical protein ACFR9U_13945 [Halorientalis brevis]|uniref:Hydrogenase maturation nickel metallochaperone HypA n=1 Tax=Halorientalis brevis TaxID=1126241 RepID=A0ABD6CDG0_9EURY|nr:hypothetical protein [Halorientalis brevis]
MGALVRIKRLLRGADGCQRRQYECLTCHATFEYRRQACPECGGYDIRSTEWLDDDERRLPENHR